MHERPHPELDAIYQAYHDRVVAYAAKLIGRDDAEDVAQEVFLKVGRALGALSDPSRMTSWIFAITANTARDVARAGATRARRISSRPGDAETGEDPILSYPDTQAPSAEELLARNEMVTCYLGYVEQLPQSYYNVYVLSEFEGLKVAEIARRLSISIGAAKIRLHRARTRLFAELRGNCRCYTTERGDLMAEPWRSPAPSTFEGPP